MPNSRVRICPAATKTTGGVPNLETLAGQSISRTPETNLSFLTKACIHNIHGGPYEEYPPGRNKFIQYPWFCCSSLFESKHALLFRPFSYAHFLPVPRRKGPEVLEGRTWVEQKILYICYVKVQ